MLQFRGLGLRRGRRLLFEQADAQIHPGQKVGITGANGCGKSSLFALILGELHADAGELQYPGDWVIAHVAQEMPADGCAAIDHVLDGDARLRGIEKQLAAAESQHQGEQLALLHSRYEQAGGYTARSRAAQLMHGLGFTAGDEARPLDSFSGGWRMRLNLARALMCPSDLLLLDEPTNHLDLDAVIWLEDWLRAYRGTLLLISHDRDFLDNVSTRIAHIEHERLSFYTGNYSDFERLRAERLASMAAQRDKQQREIRHMHAFVERFRAKATKARQAQSRLKALQRMELIAPAHVDSPFHFSLRAPLKLPAPLISLERAEVGYGGDTVLAGVSRIISPGDRIGLLGANGAGKSTLIKMLAGQIQPGHGVRNTARDLQIGYFAQHQLEQLDPRHSPLEHLVQLDPGGREQALRDYLGGFGFPGEQATSPSGPFSGGEKSRLALALLVYRRPNLLLLDEPTNHLDLEMRQALAQALQDFEGAMVLVSHDRHLLRVCCDSLLLVHDGAVSEFPDSLDDYPAWLAAQKRAEKPARTGLDDDHSAAGRRERKRIEAEQRKRLQPLRKKLDQTEGKLEAVNAQREALNRSLADNTLYLEENRERLKLLLRDKAELDSQHEQLEMQWLEVSEQLDAMR